MRAARSGFTLAEVLIYQALVLVVLSMAVLFLIPSLNLQNRGLLHAERLRGGYMVLDGLCRNLRETPETCLAFQAGVLSGRHSDGWTSEGEVLLQDEGWFFQLDDCRSARLSWQREFGLGPGCKEPLSLTQLQDCRPKLQWRGFISESARVTFRSAGPDAKPRGPYTVALRVGDLELQQTVRPRQLR